MKAKCFGCALLQAMLLVSHGVSAEGVDANSFYLGGARSEGGVLLPSPRLLPAYHWDLSLSYVHEQDGVNFKVGTGEVRGKALTREVDWIASRELLYMQLALSPLERLELGIGLPLLLGQDVSDEAALRPPRSGAAALGDARASVRYGFLQPAGHGWLASFQVAALLPTGEEDFAMGQGSVRPNLRATVGYESASHWTLGAHVGHQMAEMRTVWDQVFGDSVMLGTGFTMRHEVGPSDRVQWSVEAIWNQIVVKAPEVSHPRRSALEFLAGGRYFHGVFYADIGAGISTLHAGPTPKWRALVSVGTSGSFRADRREEMRRKEEEGRALRAELSALREEVRLANLRCDLPEPESTSGGPPVVELVDVDARLNARELERSAIFFATGKAELDSAGEQVVRQVALLLSRAAGRVRIAGYADDRGSEDLNRELSRRRAEGVRSALVEAGVSEDRLEAVGKGMNVEPVQATDFGRSINRRVGFSWIN